jgi:hypothetical protein
MKDNDLERGDIEITIDLPKDAGQVEKLKLKLAEYRERLERMLAENPQADEEALADTRYKIALLANLLEKGSINTADIARDLAELYSSVYRAKFNSAIVVINDYAITGGNLTKHNMGLKS